MLNYITMKRLVATIVLTMVFTINTSMKAQSTDSIPMPPCKQVDIATDSTKKKILAQFIQQSLQQREFINDKGIVHLYQYQNIKGDSVWLLIPKIDDSYKDNPPTEFSDFQGDIVLVYEADEKGEAFQNPNPQPFNKCLADIIGDRVYLRPIKEGRWTNHVLPWGRKMEEGVHRVALGNGGALLVIFKEDGTYETMRPA